MAVFAAGFFISGCGVPKEEHSAIVAQLQAEHAETEKTLNTKIADLESLLKAEKARYRSARLEVENTLRQVKELRQRNAEVAKKAAQNQSQIVRLEDEAESAEVVTRRVRTEMGGVQRRLAQVLANRDEIRRRFDMLRRNLRALDEGSSDPSLPQMTEMVEPEAPVIAEESAKENSDLDILPPREKVRTLLERMRSM